jgi:hypothetical protein
MSTTKGHRRWWLIIGLPLVVFGVFVAFKQQEEAFRHDNMAEQRERGEELRALRRQCDQIWDWKIELEREWDLEAYCRRPLTAAEQEAYHKLLAFAKDKQLKYTYRLSAIDKLTQHPHIFLFDNLVAIAREVPSGWRLRRQEGEAYPAAMAVFALGVTADKKVIPVLIELIGHPMYEVREMAIRRLQRLLYRGLPAKFQRGNFSYEHVKDERQRQQAVAELQEWWKKNEKTAKVNWTAAWGSH